MTLDGRVGQKGNRIVKATNAFLLLLAVILLVTGFPFFLFGVFLSVSQANGLGGDVAVRFSLGGFVSVLCALGIRAYLLRRDGWF